ncbi:MAG: hypothetical protein Q7T77_08145 [Sulfuricurvum sp.]|nr:hypothetical protein [Sulfuricurvum sp.]
MKKILTVLLISFSVAFLLSGCRVTTIEQAIMAAESNGSIPKLNHDNTITGPDKDNNGIRDDIDAYIATLPYTEVQKKAVKQHAKALSTSLTVDTTDKTALLKVADDMSRASECVYTKLADNIPSKIKSDNEKMIVNTKNRFLQYEKFNSALSGGVFASPVGDGCDN